MAASLVSIVSVLLIGFSNAAMVEQQQQVTANPIRKVVVMLQAMEKKETELYEKFMCYCKNSDGALAASIADAEAKVAQVTSDIEEGETQVAQLKADLKAHQTDRAAAKTAMAEATSL